MSVDAYDFKVRPPEAAGDVSYSEEVAAEIGRLTTSDSESMAQMHARNFGRADAIEMTQEMAGSDPEQVREVVLSLSESWNPALRAFHASGARDVFEMQADIDVQAGGAI